ncbi:AAA domain-containing protein [Algoriphagus zhangzhouensis]|uniref:Superfamily I DNA and/or RNA helicase n=1 Tax=Algoriphagus zhangzhouensis TaxID=1073327 RepID=A0A1M7Z7V0_9BACT|nr:AAA domain-containing protein [Algoriphagus zhangzhouensis]TDY49393.1 superfamily I DNA and/or RNA helicase [Algoriphagus zhangzhouensis]SHO60872.1 Superfamily I DNA and/or RNA helicase [Algoriphagus zhangzhouensis]
MPQNLFQFYLNRLTDLSTRNRSLYLPKLEGYGMIDVLDFDFLIGAPAFSLIEQLIQGKKKIKLIPEIDPRSGVSNQLSKALSRLAYRDQLTQEETGEQSLYIGWLFVEGKLVNGQLVRSPLLLKSIALLREKGEWTLKSDGDWEFNPAFLLAWKHAIKSDFGDDFPTDLSESLSTDPREFRVQLNQLIQEHFSIQVQSNLLEDRIIAFPNSQISVDQEKFQEGKVSLKPYAVLGQFSQKGSFLFSDYELLQKTHLEESLEEVFQNRFIPDKYLSEPREEDLYPVFPLDSSQEKVLVQVRKGKSLVVQGPPGTGKSQLITNLISDFVSRGKRVLVVSQKRAALDVVFERLDQLGFGDFLALVHDFRGDRNLLFEKIRKQIDAIETYQEESRGMDSIQLEREISVLSRTIARLSSQFEGLRESLFDSEACGLPAKSLYLQARSERPFFKSKDLIRLDWDEAKDFEQNYRIYYGYQTKFGEGFWQKRISFSNVSTKDYSQITDALNSVEEFREKNFKNLEFKNWKKVLESLLESNQFLDDLKKAYSSFEGLENPTVGLEIIRDKKLRNELELVQDFLREWIDSKNSWTYQISGSLQDLEVELKELIPQSQSWFGKLKAKLNRPKFPLVFQVLQENQLPFHSENLLSVLNEVGEKIKINNRKEELSKITFFDFSEFPKQDIQRVQKLNTWFESWSFISSYDLINNLLKSDNQDFKENLESLLALLEVFRSQCVRWRNWLSNNQILDLLESGLKEVISEPEINWQTIFSELKSFDQLMDNWSQRGLAKELWTQGEGLGFGDQIDLFWNGWYLNWISELERRNPLLAEAGSLKMVQEMSLISTSILEKRKLSHHISLLRIKERFIQDLEYNRLGNRVTFRELLHQVSKKRQKWSVRKLVQELEEEVFRTMPCWLCSPETVSAVFPIEQQFDLVIFDEASQCPVEKGIPAMLRGKQVVIAGDSRQLKPSDFYQIRWESEEEGLELESESLLGLASNFFENASLKGHYRSADPGLIHFSNQYFYEGKLEALPDYPTVTAGLSPFSWEKVEGIWENQVNRMEADAVVKKVEAIFKDSSKTSIGVVTGNYFQMELIRDLLWKEGIQDAFIKVRNIENVQGDEFDEVILSLGYGPNREGKLVTNFGLLGKSGAANRLNVAVTRARKKMHVISSIEPEDFRPKQLENEGLRLLKEYLSFVKAESKVYNVPALEIVSRGFETDWSLKNKLLTSSDSYSMDVPSSLMDLIFTESEGERVAILTDDQRFFNASSAKAAMAYHPILLEQKGWKWKWNWSREFFLKNG